MNIVSPFFADLMLGLMYLMLVVALAVTAWSVWHTLRSRRKGDDIVNGVPAGRIGWCVSKPVMTNGVRFADTFWLKTTDMFIYSSILLIIGCFVSAIISRFRS